MRRRRYVYALLIACLTLMPARAQQDFSKVQMKATKVAGNIYMLEGAGGNIGVSAGADGLLIVDDQFAPLAERIRAALREINPGQLRFVLNTHYHGDHTGGNPVFGKEATIIAHDNVRGRLATEQTVRGQKIPASPQEALPVITFNQSVSIHFNGEEIRVIHFPAGHTDGDSIIFFAGSNVVHMGDHYFAGRFPFIDLEHGGTVEGLRRNIEAVIARVPADVKIIPGHGPLSTLDDLKLYRRMLMETTAHVRRGMAAGKTLAQLKTAGLPAEWTTWGTGFINTGGWIETIFNGSPKGRKVRK
ncbi:MAG TPA: MBL fold metallo-hydrolase [Pyrinomonadaceae bacterium]|nr:MBL fold metallo-hydrolase [Pyrinomonadaceae bacterium]